MEAVMPVQVEGRPQNVLLEEPDNDDVDDHEEDNLAPEPEQARSSAGPQYTGPLDPRRMIITAQERERAMAIKEMVEMMPDLDNLSDFCCGQLAIADEGNVQRSIERAFGLQTFRQEYDILDTPEEGCRVVRDLIKLFPELYLCFHYSQNRDRYVLVFDLPKHDSSVLKNDPNSFLTWIKGGYYMAIAINPDLACTRNGIIQVVECEGFKLSKNLDMTYFRQMQEELLDHYPQNYHQFKHFHTGVLVNMVYSMAKKLFLPEKMTSKFQVGCTFDARLDTIYHVPSVEEANKRLLNRLEDTIMRHYENERVFKL